MYARVWKRVLDVILSLAALVVLSPVLVMLIVMGMIVMGGNPFFTQIRPGKDEKLFRLVKFRSMSNRKGADGKLLPDEKRLTGYGRFIRATSLDIATYGEAIAAPVVGCFARKPNWLIALWH